MCRVPHSEGDHISFECPVVTVLKFFILNKGPWSFILHQALQKLHSRFFLDRGDSLEHGVSTAKIKTISANWDG